MISIRKRKLWLTCCLVVWCLPVSILSAAEEENAARCMALNLYWEARSEGQEGMLAVGWVVLNRMAHPKFPNTVCGVIQQGGKKLPCEWTWWCDGRSDRPTEPKAWAMVQALAQELLSQPPEDPSFGALWLHHEKLGVPKWLKSREPTSVY